MHQNRLLVTIVLFLLVTSAGLGAGCQQKGDSDLEVEPVLADSLRREIGRHLFYDRRMSFNQSKSCASCHAPQFSFTDGYRRSIGATGENHQRNARPLINLAAAKYFTAADSSIQSIREQMLRPMFNEHPVELGWSAHENAILQRLSADSFYQAAFSRLYTQKKGVSREEIQVCISAFVAGIESNDSPFDVYNQGNVQAMSPSAIRGMSLFYSKRTNCSRCHSGSNFDQPRNGLSMYQNTGLYNTANTGNYPQRDQGLFETTGNAADRGAFRIPTLRNLAFTAPYYHDGSAASLAEVIESYDRGGRLISAGPDKGDGALNPFRSKEIKPLHLSESEKKDLLNFLYSLSDTEFVHRSAYSNPFVYDETHH